MFVFQCRLLRFASSCFATTLFASLCCVANVNGQCANGTCSIQSTPVVLHSAGHINQSSFVGGTFASGQTIVSSANWNAGHPLQSYSSYTPTYTINGQIVQNCRTTAGYMSGCVSNGMQFSTQYVQPRACTANGNVGFQNVTNVVYPVSNTYSGPIYSGQSCVGGHCNRYQ